MSAKVSKRFSSLVIDCDGWSSRGRLGFLDFCGDFENFIRLSLPATGMRRDPSRSPRRRLLVKLTADKGNTATEYKPVNFKT